MASQPCTVQLGIICVHGTRYWLCLGDTIVSRDALCQTLYPSMLCRSKWKYCQVAPAFVVPCHMCPVQKLVCSTPKTQQGPEYACACSIGFFRSLLDFSCHLEDMVPHIRMLYRSACVCYVTYTTKFSALVTTCLSEILQPFWVSAKLP